MNTNLLATAAALAVGLAAVPAAAIRVTGDPVRFWQDVMINTIALPPDLAGHPYAMVDVAMFDAVNQTSGKHYQAIWVA